MNRKPQMINIVMFGGKKDKKDKDSIKDKTKKKNVQTKCTSIRKTSMFVF